MAAQWIHEFVKLSGNVMLPYMPGILMAQLPNLVFDDERRRNMTEDQYKRKQYITQITFLASSDKKIQRIFFYFLIL